MLKLNKFCGFDERDKVLFIFPFEPYANGTRATHFFFLMKHLLKFSVSFTLLFAFLILMASYLLYNDNFFETFSFCIKNPIHNPIELM